MDGDRVEALDPDQDRLMLAFGVLPARLWVPDDPDWTVYAISDRLAVVTGECVDHGRHEDLVVALDGHRHLHALGEASDSEDLGRLLAGHPCLSVEDAGELLAGLQRARP